MTELTLDQLKALTGGLSSPGKMPCHGYSLPARECKTGGRLREVAGSTCHGCYAFKGRYAFGNVQAALYRRYEAYERPEWPQAMAELIRRKESRSVPVGRRTTNPPSGHFRWHDSGDLQSVAHLERICQVAELTPDVKHWLPTREYRIVSEFLEAGGVFPPNLTVRMSAHMIGGRKPTGKGLPISTVSRDEADYPDAHQCPARHQENTCGDCRACWAPDVAHVDYHLH